MFRLSCKSQDLECEFRADGETPAETVSKYIAHCLETHRDFLGGLRESMSEDDIRAMLLKQTSGA